MFGEANILQPKWLQGFSIVKHCDHKVLLYVHHFFHEFDTALIRTDYEFLKWYWVWFEYIGMQYVPEV